MASCEPKEMATVELPEGEYSNPVVVGCSLIVDDTFILTVEMDRVVRGLKNKFTQQTVLTLFSEKRMRVMFNPWIEGNNLKIGLETSAKACKTCGAYNMPTRPKVKLFRCSRCRDACYCSRECQAADWQNHKLGCLESPNA
jgi:hypothetical protein